MTVTFLYVLTYSVTDALQMYEKNLVFDVLFASNNFRIILWWRNLCLSFKKDVIRMFDKFERVTFFIIA